MSLITWRQWCCGRTLTLRLDLESSFLLMRTKTKAWPKSQPASSAAACQSCHNSPITRLLNFPSSLLERATADIPGILLLHCPHTRENLVPNAPTPSIWHHPRALYILIKMLPSANVCRSLLSLTSDKQERELMKYWTSRCYFRVRQTHRWIPESDINSMKSGGVARMGLSLSQTRLRTTQRRHGRRDTRLR